MHCHAENIVHTRSEQTNPLKEKPFGHGHGKASVKQRYDNSQQRPFKVVWYLRIKEMEEHKIYLLSAPLQAYVSEPIIGKDMLDGLPFPPHLSNCGIFVTHNTTLEVSRYPCSNYASSTGIT